VVCQFGAMFFPDRVGAFGEARRVLRDGGLLLVVTWGRLDHHSFQSGVHRALERAVPDDPPRYLLLPHSCDDPDRLAAEIAAAGLIDAQGERLVLESPPAELDDLVAGYCLGTPIRVQLEARGDLSLLLERVGAELRADLGSDPVVGQMEAVVASGRRPPPA
jgi:SAM-dependent methyltransferase